MKADRGNVNRRYFLTGVGAAAGLAISRSDTLFRPSVSDLSLGEAFSALNQSLTEFQRQHTYCSIDDPIRQITKTETVHRGPHIGTLYNPYQISLIRQMYKKLVSNQGLNWFHNTITLEGRFEGSSFKIYSDSASQPSLSNSQIVINGGHYMLRSSDVARSGYALGGPISYGQQLGDHQFKVRGNAFKAHGDAVDQFHRSLTVAQRQRAYQMNPPAELLIQVQGANAQYPGVAIGDVSSSSQEIALDMINTLLAAYSQEQRREAWSVIEDNGGIDTLHVALYCDFGFYADGSRYSTLDDQQRAIKGLPYIQVWRIEGPASIIHFKGYPHVHGYMNFVRDSSAIAVGEALAETQVAIGAKAVRKLMLQVLKLNTEQQVAYYPDLVQGRLSPGIISTGSVYGLDPFNNKMVVADMSVQGMSEDLKRSLVQQGIVLNPGRVYKIATIDYSLQRPDLFGRVEAVKYFDLSMRTALIEHIRKQSLSAIQS